MNRKGVFPDLWVNTVSRPTGLMQFGFESRKVEASRRCETFTRGPPFQQLWQQYPQQCRIVEESHSSRICRRYGSRLQLYHTKGISSKGPSVEAKVGRLWLSETSPYENCTTLAFSHGQGKMLQLQPNIATTTWAK